MSRGSPGSQPRRPPERVPGVWPALSPASQPGARPASPSFWSVTLGGSCWAGAADRVTPSRPPPPLGSWKLRPLVTKAHLTVSGGRGPSLSRGQRWGPGWLADGRAMCHSGAPGPCGLARPINRSQQLGLGGARQEPWGPWEVGGGRGTAHKHSSTRPTLCPPPPPSAPAQEKAGEQEEPSASVQHPGLGLRWPEQCPGFPVPRC